MTDGTGNTRSLADLLALDGAEVEGFDWDPSALADWPNISLTAPVLPASSSAESDRA